MNISPNIGLLVDGKRLSIRQIEALAEVSKTRSQSQASRELGISTPVLHRYIRRAEKELGFSLIRTTPIDSRLTPEAIEMVKAYKRYIKATTPHPNLAVACTPITQNLLLETLSDLEKDGNLFDVYIGDDKTNLRLLEAGEVDLVLFDDPLNVYEYEGDFDHREIAFDTLYHVDRGKSYCRFRYGAQRIGFGHLRSRNIDYSIESNLSGVESLLNSGRSYFINQSLVVRIGLDLTSQTPVSTFNHAIIAMILEESEELQVLVHEMKKRSSKFGFIT
ncbi:MAG: LysR family transcriptional regulator [Halobacteriota archaeon]|nr:LysR family transcriptional regulator [Halobacteriota archaeon]